MHTAIAFTLAVAALAYTLGNYHGFVRGWALRGDEDEAEIDEMYEAEYGGEG